MDEKNLKTWKSLIPSLSEAQKRWYIGQKAIELGRGGIAQMHSLTGLSENTIIRGMREVKRGKPEKMGARARNRGGGRKRIDTTEPDVSALLHEILDESTAGDPMSPIKWTRKSCRTIEQELRRKKIDVSYPTVCRLLHESGYTLQSNRKDKEGKSHPDRDLQFRFIAGQASVFLDTGRPVISVDTKKKERVGEFKNAGETWRTKGTPEKVNVYDFPNLAIGTAVPYGTYDVARNEGFVNVGMSHDTAEFAVESIRQWWKLVGKKHYSKTKELLICADGGGSNSSASRRWKVNLQKFSDATGLKVTVCHYPPGTSKWNKIEHRMFSFISMNWRGKPLVSYETVVNLIGATKTAKGLQVRARLDRQTYEKGIKATDEEMESLAIQRLEPFPRWNYIISPRKPNTTN